jgi:hypothetical protein
MEIKSYPAFTGARWIVWKPLPGLDVSLGEEALWIAAARYAQLITAGKPEMECQNEAEKVAFEHHYGVKYEYSN